ncbi:MAG: esterase [Flavobacteriales bacterium]|nr:esterase [Flavobacteriales bacterium]|tara:strand:+ start:6258 stop:6683 length:426 start_codon:yes stop_codon:yes gene_type:complete
MWKSDYSVDQVNSMSKNTILDVLGIEITEIGDDFLTGKMPVDSRTVQPMRILHGGANVVLAETLGSIASLMIINPEEEISVGVDINANHIRSVKSGWVTGVAKPLSIGRKIHVWEIKINDEGGRLTCISRLTVSVLPKKNS